MKTRVMSYEIRKWKHTASTVMHFGFCLAFLQYRDIDKGIQALGSYAGTLVLHRYCNQSAPVLDRQGQVFPY
jgi:hypothetical protein